MIYYMILVIARTYVYNKKRATQIDYGLTKLLLIKKFVQMRKLTFIDLFAGCGGLSEGFLSTNKFVGLAHVEWELPMVETLRNRLEKKWRHSNKNSYKRVVHFDIQKSQELIDGKWSKESIIDFGKTNHKDVITAGLKGLVGDQKVDIIMGGPPCQAYSIAGRAQDKNSMNDDYRNYLFESFIKVVTAFKPDICVFENVPGMLSAKPGGVPVTERIHKAFRVAGYDIKKNEELKQVVFSSSDFGVPQKRRRVIIIGVKRTENKSLNSIYSSIRELATKTKPMTVRDAIGHLPGFIPAKTPSRNNNRNISHIPIHKAITDIHHKPRFHNPRDIKIFRQWILSKMNKKSLIEKIDFYNKLMNKYSKHAKYRNLEWDQPSPTIVAHLHKDGLMFIHPDHKQARSITVRESATLQSFPKDYEFCGSQGSCYKMIGNAVPPRMAKVIANGIQSYMINNTTT